VGDRAGEGAANGNLGIAYGSQSDCSQTIKYHTQRLAIAKEVGDRAGEGQAYGNLGNEYQSLSDYEKAIEYHAQHLAVAKEVGDRAGKGKTYGNPGSCHILERVRQSRRLPQSTTCLGNIAEVCTCAVPRSAESGCRTHPSRRQLARALLLALTKPWTTQSLVGIGVRE
jgi:tetratricopeptide (TPR) repeat protein